MGQTALQGNLSTFSIEDVLNFVDEKRQTGILEIERQEGPRQVYFQKGKLICLSGLLRGSSMAALLYRRRSIDRTQFEKISKTDNEDLMSALSAALDFQAPGIKEDFEETISILFTEEIVDLFSMQDGNFQFTLQDLECPKPLQRIMDVTELQEQGRELRAQWSQILKTVPDWDLYPRIADLDTTKLEQFQPDINRWRALSIVDGRRSVKDLAAISPWGRFATLSGLAEFHQKGIIVFSEEPLPAPERLTRASDMLDIPQETASFLDSFRTRDHAKGYQPRTVVGVLGEFLNDLLKGYSSRKEFELEAGFLASQWHDILIQFPSADQIAVNGKGVSVAYLEHLLAAWNDDGSSADVVTCSVEALKELAEAVHSKASELMGEKRALSIYKKVHGGLSHHQDLLTEEQIQALGLAKD